MGAAILVKLYNATLCHPTLLSAQIKLLMEYAIAPTCGISLCFFSVQSVHDHLYSLQRKR